MRGMLIGAMVAAFAWSAPAFAQAEACEAAVKTSEVKRALDGVDRAILYADDEEARKLVVEAERSMECLGELVDKEDLARFAQQKAIVAFWDQDESGALAWGLLARDSGTLRWPPTLDGVRQLVDGAEMPKVAGSGGTLAGPPGGGVYLNGEKIETAKAMPEVYGLLQVLNESDRVVYAIWQHGTAFPDAVLGEWAGVETIPAGGKTKKPKKEKGPKEPKEKDPNAKKRPNIALLASGGGAAVLGGAALGVGFALESSFEGSDYDEDEYGGCTRGVDACYYDERFAKVKRDARMINVLYVAGYSLIGIGVTVAGVSFVASPNRITISGRF